jgi:hypothetical protein
VLVLFSIAAGSVLMIAGRQRREGVGVGALSAAEARPGTVTSRGEVPVAPPSTAFWLPPDFDGTVGSDS